LEFIGRKIMNYLSNIINLWKPPNDLRDRTKTHHWERV
jgi:hypothetical protein